MYGISKTNGRAMVRKWNMPSSAWFFGRRLEGLECFMRRFSWWRWFRCHGGRFQDGWSTEFGLGTRNIWLKQLLIILRKKGASGKVYRHRKMRGQCEGRWERRASDAIPQRIHIQATQHSWQSRRNRTQYGNILIDRSDLTADWQLPATASRTQAKKFFRLVTKTLYLKVAGILKA